MKNPSRSIACLIFFLLLPLSACSKLSITYNYADWILLWKIDSYFDISTEQKHYLEFQLEQLHHWHRKHELPIYVQFLRHIQETVKSGLSQEKLDSIIERYRELRFHLGRRIALQGTPFLTSLQPQQIQDFKHALAVENQKLRDDVEKTLQERTANRMKSVIELMELWLGEVKLYQKARIEALIQQFPDTTEDWLAYRQHRQRRFIKFLNQWSDDKDLQQQVSDWFSYKNDATPAKYTESIEKWRNSVKTVILEIDRLLTSTQRTYLVQRLQDIIYELESLTHI